MAESKEIREKYDREKLLMIFPEEIWIMILETVEDDSDLVAVINQFPFFKSLLQSKLQVILFSQLFPILRTFSENNPKENLTLDLYSPTVFNLRQVCKRWNRVLNQLHENLTATHVQLRQNLHPDDDIIEFDGPRMYLFTEDPRGANVGLQRFLDYFQNSHPYKSNANPFLGRKVTLMFNCVEEYDSEFVVSSRINWMLQQYGHHIHRCTIILKHRFNSFQLDAYNQVMEWLSNLPNLKEAEIYVPTSELYRIRGEEYIDREDQNLVDFIMQVLSLPNIEHRISNSTEIERLVYELYGMGEPNGIRDREEVEPVNENENVLEKGRLLTMYLRQLQDLFSIDHHMAEYGYGASFNVRYTPLKSLVDNKTTKTEGNFQNLPSPVCLNLSLGYYNPIDFILPMKESLQKLQITLGFQIPCSHNIKQEVEFIGFENRMLESNIWTLFPKLTKLVIVEDFEVPCSRYNLCLFHNGEGHNGIITDSVTYTRQEWEKKMSKLDMYS